MSEKKGVTVRWPHDLREMLEKRSIKNDRSFALEVIHLVKKGLLFLEACDARPGLQAEVEAAHSFYYPDSPGATPGADIRSMIDRGMKAHPERYDSEIGFVDVDPAIIEAERARRGLPARSLIPAGQLSQPPEQKAQ